MGEIGVRCRETVHGSGLARGKQVVTVALSLILGARERPCGAHAPLGAKGQAQLLRRPQPVGVVGAEGHAGRGLGERAQAGASEEAVLAGGRSGAATSHGEILSTTVPATATIKARAAGHRLGPFRNTR